MSIINYLVQQLEESFKTASDKMGSLSQEVDDWTQEPNLHPKRKPITPAQRGVAAASSSEQFKTKSSKYKLQARRWHRKFYCRATWVCMFFIMLIPPCYL